MKIGFRTGQVFNLNDDRVKQFSRCRFRGYVNDDGTPKNPFTDLSFEKAFKGYQKRNYNRKKAQLERKKKRQEAEAKKELKRNNTTVKFSKENKLSFLFNEVDTCVSASMSGECLSMRSPPCPHAIKYNDVMI